MIIEAAKIEEIAEDFGRLHKSGRSFVQDCPKCGSKKKMSITPEKDLFKCFVCDVGGSKPIGYLMRVKDYGYKEALEYLADRYNISLLDPTAEKANKKRARGVSFCKAQLDASGIPLSSILYKAKVKEGEYQELPRFESATIDKNWSINRQGDDMIIHYLGLDFLPLTYRDERGKEKPFFRVRFANPALHGKEGERVKYKSPYRSGSHLYLPNDIIKAVRDGRLIDTLIITEGEKKAEKLTLHDMPAVGIAGIHNFSVTDEMPWLFQRIIQECGVKRLVFLLDSDFQDLKIKEGRSVDERPRTFYKAVIKFRDYFRAYAQDGIDLDLFFGSHRDFHHKGVDDLLVYKLKGNEDELRKDLEKAMIDRENKGELLDLWRITSMSDYKLAEIWALHSEPAFFDKHKETLKDLKTFKFKKLERRFNEEGEVELAQPLLPSEEFWKVEEWESRNGKVRRRYNFRYQGARNFLRNRGYGKYRTGAESFRFIHQNGRIVTEVAAQDIRDYVLDFTESLGEREVLEILLSGGFRYFGEASLLNMYGMEPPFIEARKGEKYLIFKNVAWRITADDIEVVDLGKLPGYVWADKMIDFQPKKMEKPLFEIERKAKSWELHLSDDHQKSDFAMYLSNTSNFAWRKAFDVKRGAEGQLFTIPRSDPEEYTEAEVDVWTRNYISKLLATGYLLNDYRDRANMRAVVAMDGIESEVGASNGGTGKSIWGTMFRYIAKIFVIDAKAPRLTEKNFLYDGVDERTNIIVFDDCRVNLDFESFLSQITSGLQVEPKGEKAFKLDPPPYFIFLTNHAIKGDDNSTLRRQYLISFSDYYNAWRTPKDDFGGLMFYEWDFDQWNLFYNYMASCIQAYLKYGLAQVMDTGDLKKRRLRQQIGDALLDWFSRHFVGDIDKLNIKWPRRELYDSFIREHRDQARYIPALRFKKLLEKCCEYYGLEFNPNTDGKRYKSNGVEFITIGNEDFNMTDWASDAYIRAFDNEPNY